MLQIVQNLVYVCLLWWVYLPLYFAGMAMIKLKLIINQAKKLSGIKFISQGTMTPVARRCKVCDVGKISTDEEIDFLTHRSLAYVTRMTLWTAKELAKLAVRRQCIELIPDSQLCYVLFNTVYAHSLTWDSQRKMYCLDLSEMGNLTLFEGFYWEATRVYVDPRTEKIVIIVDNDQELHSDCSLKDKADYNLAKLHLQICMTYYAPGLSHNYVHFVFPSAVCIYAKLHLRQNSIIYRLLAPHFRFMERLNYQAMRISHASSNTRSFGERIFCFWKPFPVTKEQFSGGMTAKLEEYYIKLGSQVCSKPAVSETIGNGTNGAPSNMSNKPLHRKHRLFPPAYVDDPEMQKIPYLNYLSQYYHVIRNFVKDMEPYIDSDDWNCLQRSIAEHVPRFEEVNKVDAIATFIHSVAVVHSADHSSYTDYFAREYGCMSIRAPYERFSNKEFWRDFEQETGISTESVKKDPTKLINQTDVMRMRCFTNVFVDYIPSSTCDLSLITTNYNFQDDDADVIMSNFKSDLRCLDGHLKGQTPPIETTKGPGNRRATGMQIIKVNDLIRSNCF